MGLFVNQRYAHAIRIQGIVGELLASGHTNFSSVLT